MGALEGRVTVITGAGRGIGREHALLFAREGAQVVVNDLGGGPDGSGADTSAAQAVVDEIVAAGGEAVANNDDVADFDGAGRLIAQAVATYGRLDVLVSNAGILRDGLLHSMTEAQWDEVVRVHLKGHWSPLRHAVDHWRARAKAGEYVNGAVINTASASGTLMTLPGQANYAAAKAGIAALTLAAAAELARLGVRTNAIAPAARTRLTIDVPMIGELVAAPDDPAAFDAFHPSEISPLVAWLATEDCPVSGNLYSVRGGKIAQCSGWQELEAVTTGEPWSIDAIAERLGRARV